VKLSIHYLTQCAIKTASNIKHCNSTTHEIPPCPTATTIVGTASFHPLTISGAGKKGKERELEGQMKVRKKWCGIIPEKYHYFST
jgi:hypothetical protein